MSDPKTKDQKYHYEEKLQGGVTRGQYAVADPDGTVRTVNYVSNGENGFYATVTKTGPSVHPKRYYKPARRGRRLFL